MTKSKEPNSNCDGCDVSKHDVLFWAFLFSGVAVVGLAIGYLIGKGF